jgi:hypothetical protein
MTGSKQPVVNKTQNYKQSAAIAEQRASDKK